MNLIRIVAVYNYQIKNNIYQKYPNVTPSLWPGIPPNQSSTLRSEHIQE